MTFGSKPPADIAIDQSLVRALLQEQHPDLADLPLLEVGEGWDNKLFRLGDALAVRLPRRLSAVVLIEQEQRWLPVLAPRLPLAVPTPLRVGVPGCGFPWPWSIAPWFPGQTALLAPPHDAIASAAALRAFLRALHQPAPEDAPHNPWRGVTLAARTPLLLDHLQKLDDLDNLFDRTAVLALWDRVLAVPPWSGAPVWIHGDLHPGNLVVRDGRLSAVIDFGDLTAGDPATDWSVFWMTGALWNQESALEGLSTIDDHMAMRARGWALALGISILSSSRDDRSMSAMAQATIRAALNDLCR